MSMDSHESNVARLRGGPFDGLTVPVTQGAALNCEGDGVPDGHVAVYRPSREAGVYSFRGISAVVARIPAPGGRE